MKNGDGLGHVCYLGYSGKTSWSVVSPVTWDKNAGEESVMCLFGRNMNISQREQHTQDAEAEVSFGMCGWCSDNMRKGVGEGLQEVIKADDSSVTYHC